MLQLIGKRLLLSIPILLIVSFGIFVMVDLAPGDPAEHLAGDNPTPEVLRSIRAELNLDDPLPVRYAKWAGNAVQGDFGKSFVTRQEVMPAIMGRVPITLSIALLAISWSIVSGVVLGIAGSLRPGGIVDRGVTTVSSILLALPPFWIALVLVVPFAVDRRLLPVFGYVSLSESPWEWFRHLILPVTAYSLAVSAEIAMQLKSSMTDTLGRDFILSARARGLATRSVVFKHALRSASIPLATIIALRLGVVLGGTVIIEQIFAINGVGTLAFGAAQSQDVPILLGIVTLTTLAVVMSNVLADISYGFLNPKLRG